MCSHEAIPASHFPVMCVRYPASRSRAAMPVMFLGIPAHPLSGLERSQAAGLSFVTQQCTGSRPLWRLARVGEQ